MLEELFLYRIVTRCGDPTTASEGAEARSRAPADSVEQLTRRIGALELALEALLRLLLKEGKLREDEFLKLVQQVDAEDGTIDGRRDASKLRKRCPGCGKYSSATRLRCMWCNEDLGSVKAEIVPAIS